MENKIDMQKLAEKRRSLYRRNTVVIDNASFDVVDIFPLTESNPKPDTVSDKIRFLISGEKINRNVAGL